MGQYSRGICKIVACIFIVVAVTLTLPWLSQVIFLPLPEPSPTFDCDDSTLMMYQHFQRLGIESTPIVGNLEMEGEAYMDCDHVWLLVKAGGLNIAYDWGTPRFDAQHYEGYTISLDYLLYAVEDDRVGSESFVLTDY